MFKIFFKLVVVLSVFYSFMASSEEITFTDLDGNAWTRWILKEKVTENNTLLLVVEKPNGINQSEEQLSRHSNRLSQISVFKKYYNEKNQADRLLKDFNFYAELKDLPKHLIELKKELSLQKQFTEAEPLWIPVKNEWTLEDEKKYENWFQTNVNAHFALGENVNFDCADFAVFARWIYAHDNRLPVANTLSGSTASIK